MAQNFLSINRGQLDAQLGNVVATTSVPTADFYFQMLTTNNPTRKDAVLALRTFASYIESNGIPGAGPGIDLPPL